MSNKRIKKEKPEENREERTGDTYNERRKLKYHNMFKHGELGQKELAKYDFWRVAIKRERTLLAKNGLTLPSLPSLEENPLRRHYDLAEQIYYTYICPRCKEKESDSEEEQSSLHIARDLANFLMDNI